jgi:hypothetical protein
VQLCNITVSSIDTYLQLGKLVKDVETEATDDLRYLQGPRQFSVLVGVLGDVVEALEETKNKLNRTALPEDCCTISAFRTLVRGLESIPDVAKLVRTHAQEAYTANKAGMRLPDRNVVGLIRNTCVELLALQRGDVESDCASWEERVHAVKAMLERAGQLS